MARTIVEDGGFSQTYWFDIDKAERFDEGTVWDGSNRISRATGDQWDHEAVYHTRGARWVLGTYSNRQGVLDTYTYMSADQARDWLVRNEHGDETLVRLFGGVEDERGPGRPALGPRDEVRLGGLRGRVDAYAEENGYTRAEAIRELVFAGLIKTYGH